MVSDPSIASDAPTRRPLSQLGVGTSGRVCACEASGNDAAYLSAMGLRPSAVVRVCRRGDPCIVDVSSAGAGRCRIGLAERLASRLMVSIEA